MVEWDCFRAPGALMGGLSVLCARRKTHRLLAGGRLVQEVRADLNLKGGTVSVDDSVLTIGASF